MVQYSYMYMYCIECISFHIVYQINSGSGVNEEMRDLLARVTELQKEKWELEERVHTHSCTHHTYM